MRGVERENDMVKILEHPQPKRPRTVSVRIIDGLLSLPARIVPEEQGGYSCSVPSLPGCFSCGDTFEEACAMIEEAAKLHFSCVLEDILSEGARAVVARRAGKTAGKKNPVRKPVSVALA